MDVPIGIESLLVLHSQRLLTELTTSSSFRHRVGQQRRVCAALGVGRVLQREEVPVHLDLLRDERVRLRHEMWRRYGGGTGER